MTRSDPRVNSLIMQVVENQLRDNKPPETAQTLGRLMDEGLAADVAKHLIGSALVAEMYHVLKSSTPFNPERFIALLHKLPALPESD
jgi:hypothetical protein